MTTAGVLLAAGLSRRFGTGDKLLAPFRGSPLVSHAASALRTAELSPLIAVVTSDAVASVLDGFEIVAPEGRTADQAASLRAGIARAAALGADRALVALGDMPEVTSELVTAVAARCDAAYAAAATDGARPMPPACFPAVLFPDLRAIRGDAGARDLLGALPRDRLVHAAPELLRDVDRPEDLSD